MNKLQIVLLIISILLVGLVGYSLDGLVGSFMITNIFLSCLVLARLERIFENRKQKVIMNNSQESPRSEKLDEMPDYETLNGVVGT